MEAFLGQFKNPSAIKKEKEEKGAKESKAQIPWIEKYRPKRVEDVVHQDEVVAILKKCLQGEDFPNLLFYGPPGTGKTSTILALCREMYKDLFKNRVLELNASDERGIQVIREKVRKFSQLTASGKREDGSACPTFKIVILDEADSMTKAAQAALRRTMERESKSTRFCLICNYISCIIDPIASRCSKLRFKPLPEELIMGRLQLICKSEGIEVESDDVLMSLVDISEGDMRKATTLLQTSYRFNGSDQHLTTDSIRIVSPVIPDEWIEKTYAACETKSYKSLEEIISELISEAYSGSQFLLQFHDYILFKCKRNDSLRAPIFEKIALADFQLMNGANEYLQLLDVATFALNKLSG